MKELQRWALEDALLEVTREPQVIRELRREPIRINKFPRGPSTHITRLYQTRLVAKRCINVRIAFDEV